MIVEVNGKINSRVENQTSLIRKKYINSRGETLRDMSWFVNYYELGK